MADVSHRVAIVFRHPKSDEDKPKLIGVTISWLLANGVPLTEKGKPWIYQSVELIQ